MKDAGILLIHGFAGDIEEIRPLRDHLTQSGYIVVCPLLKGHGETKKELSETTYNDWIVSARSAYLELAGQCARIVAVGFSMGGLIAVNLWDEKFAGLVTVNTPIYYWNPKIITENLSRDFRKYGKQYFAAAADKSLASMIEFQKLLTRTKPMLCDMTCKTLVVQAMDDDTVNPKSADYILKKVSGEKSVCRIPKGGHLIFLSDESKEVCKIIADFIKTC